MRTISVFRLAAAFASFALLSVLSVVAGGESRAQAGFTKSVSVSSAILAANVVTIRNETPMRIPYVITNTRGKTTHELSPGEMKLHMSTRFEGGLEGGEGGLPPLSIAFGGKSYHLDGERRVGRDSIGKAKAGDGVNYVFRTRTEFNPPYDLVRTDSPPPSSPPPSLTRSTVYFFTGPSYAAWSVKEGKRIHDLVSIARYWPNMFSENIDAAAEKEGIVYFFRGNLFTAWNVRLGRLERGPTRIADFWPGMFTENLNAAVEKEGLVYFFRGNEFTAWNVRLGRLERGPTRIADFWPGMPDHPQAVVSIP
jgi:hypothetical protein